MNIYTIEEKAYKYRHFLLVLVIAALTFDGCEREPEPAYGAKAQCYSDADCIERDGTEGGGMP